MAEAKLNSPRRFYFLPEIQNLGLDGLLTLSVYDDAGVAIEGSPFDASLVVSPAEVGLVGLYSTGLISFPAVGAYLLVWSCVDPAIKVTEEVTVLEAPLGDFPTQVSRKFRYSSPGFAAVADVVLRVLKDGVKVGATHSTLVTGVAGVYETADEFLLEEAGVYLFLWTSAAEGYVFTQAETWLVLTTPSDRVVSVSVIDASVDPQIPQAGIDVLVSAEDGTPLAQARTNADGQARFLLPLGDYVATARKAGYTYSKNNLSFEVTDDDENRFFLLATPFLATFDPAPLFDVSSLSTMTVDLADMRGEPLVGRKVFVSNRSVPDKKTGFGGKVVGLFGEPIELVTDGNGHAETPLVRGQKVTVAIEGTTVRRTITVPDQASFDFLELVTSDDDPFDIQILNIPAAERRS